VPWTPGPASTSPSTLTFTVWGEPNLFRTLGARAPGHDLTDRLVSHHLERVRELLEAAGGVLAHVLSYGAVRREALAAVLAELGARVPSSRDPIEWEAGR
jgi:hypothetical protein